MLKDGRSIDNGRPIEWSPHLSVHLQNQENRQYDSKKNEKNGCPPNETSRHSSPVTDTITTSLRYA